MKKTEPEQNLMTDAELDAALAQMAEEVPPVPADFHDRWMSAVRAEAKGSAPAAEEPAPKNHTVSVMRWTRILSVAAAFVFLIGGTLLYRNSRKSLSSVPYAAEKREAAVSAAAPAATEDGAVPAAGEAQAVPAAEEETAAAEEDTAYALKAEGAVQNGFAASAKNDAGFAGEAAYEAAYDAAYEADCAAEEEYAAEAEYAEEAEYAGEAAYEAAPATAAPTEAPAAALTAAPTAALTAAPTAAPADTPAPAEEPEAEETGFLPAAGAFFTDMGDFLLAALPYLLVLAVPAAAALVIRGKKKNRGGN